MLVVFTVGTYNRDLEGRALSLNILSVVLLENPCVDELEEVVEVPGPIGVADETIEDIDEEVVPEVMLV